MKKNLQPILPFALVALFGISLGVSVLSAQGAEDSEEEVFELEDFEVQASPIIASQQSSIALQREALGVVNIAASDYVGRFPDQNAAAALSRFPAVAVQRDQGQARFVQVRGAPARWTTLALDNIDVVGAESRISRFDAVPAAIIDKLEVHKTLTSDMPAQSIAGRINVITDSGLGRNGYTVDAEVGFGFLELGNGTQERASVRLLAGGDKWGLSGAASHYKMDQVTDNREYAWSDSGLLTEMIAQNYVVERQNNAGYIKLEYAPDARTALTFSSIYTEFKDAEQRNRITFDVGYPEVVRVSQTSVSGELIGVPMKTWMQDGRESNSTWTNTLAGKHGLEGDWNLSWRLNYTETAHSYELPLVYRYQHETADPTRLASFDYFSASPPDTPEFSLFDTVIRPEDGALAKGPSRDTINQKAYDIDVFVPVERFTESDAIVIAADLDKAWSMEGIPSLFKAGFQVDSRRIDGYLDSDYNALGGFNFMAKAIGADWDADSYLSNKKWDSDFPLGFDVYYYNYGSFNDDLFRLLGQLEAAGLYDPSNDQLDSGHYSINEDIFSVFAMNSWSFENSTFVAGLRMESVKLENHGLPGSGGAIDQNQDYTHLFPSLHYNVDLKDNLKLRVAGVSGISRPGFSQLRLGVLIDNTDKVVTSGNPELGAETAYGLDVSLEWYFETAALLSVGAFHRQVDEVLYDFSAKVGDDRFDSGGVDRSGYLHNTTFNGGRGHLSGLEFSYMQRWTGLPEFLDGLGMQLNAALIEGGFDGPNGREVRFPGTSDALINASLFYENFGFSLRLSYQWRDSWADDLSWEREGDFYWAAYGQLDFSLRHQWSRSLSFFFDANNLGDSRTVRYRGGRQFPVEVEGFGRRYMFGIRGVF